MPIAGVETEFVVFAIVAALGGGAFGAAIGALPSFIFAGFLTIAGAVEQATTGSTTFYSAAFGPFFGPHVGFAGGCAAHAYAAKHTELQSKPDWAFHDAKNILISLGARSDVLVVGALFGAGGEALKLGTDFVTGMNANYGFAHIAWIVVASAFIHQAGFGYPLMGNREKVSERLLSGKIPESGAADGGEEFANGGESSVTNRVEETLDTTSWLSFEFDEAEPHLPWQFYWKEVLVLGGFIGLASGYITIITENPWLTFGISAASLVFLETGFGFRPDTDRAGTVVTHQITLPSAIAALAALQGGALGGSVTLAMAWALIFGVLGAFFRELTERLFYAWGDTHLDPPAFSITITVLLLVILSTAGILAPNAYQAIAFHRF